MKLSKLFWILFLTTYQTFAAHTKDEVRFLVPADEWGNYKDLKGTFLKIDLHVEGNPPRMLDLYKNPSFEGNPFLRIDNAGRIFSGNDHCFRTSKGEKVLISPHVQCGYLYCIPQQGQASRWGYGEVTRKRWVYSKTKKFDCPVGGNFLHLVESRDVETWYLLFPSDENVLNHDFLKVSLGKTEAYMDIRFCRHKENNNKCLVIKKEKSDLDDQIEQLAIHQVKKDIQPLNQLIENLLPCVLDKNIPCVQKYIVTPKDVTNDHFFKKFKYSEPAIDQKYLEDLKTCLSYKMLLPHLLGSRANDRICVFYDAGNSRSKPPRGHYKIFPLMHPEGVRRNEDFGLLFVEP